MNKTLAVAVTIFVLILSFMIADKYAPEWTASTSSSSNSTHINTGPSHGNGGYYYGGGGGGGGGSTTTPTDTTIQFFTDESTTTQATSINWGTITPGQTVTRILYMKNNSPTSKAVTMSTTDWILKSSDGTVLNNTIYQQYFTFTWDYDGVVIDGDNIASTVLTLTVSADINMVSTFAFNMYFGWMEE